MALRETKVNSERLLMLASHLDSLSKDQWDYTKFVVTDNNDVLLRGDALGHCSTLWPDEFYIKNGQLYSKEGSRNPIHHATEFFDITLITCLNLFGLHHAVDYFGTEDITHQMVAGKIRSLINNMKSDTTDEMSTL